VTTVDAFRDAAAELRSVIDSAGSEPLHEYARRVRNAVARVYLAASMLPERATGCEEPPAGRGGDWSAVSERIKTYFGPELADQLAVVYARLDNGPGAAADAEWQGRAIEVLRPLHRLSQHA
jgi:hypothetical protein